MYKKISAIIVCLFWVFLCVVIIGNNDELFFYNRRATIIHNEHVSTSLKINPHTEAFPVIAFNLPNKIHSKQKCFGCIFAVRFVV